MALLITFSEQQAIKPIADNSEKRFNQIMEETQINELQDLLGFRLYQDITENPTSAANKILLDGTTWTYGEQTIRMNGLKYVLAHYFFSNYTRENPSKDTYSGHMNHSIPEANPVGDIARAKIEKRARETAYKFWREVELYLNNNSADYEYWCCGSEGKVFKPKMKRLTRVVTNTDYDTNIFSKRNVTGSGCC